MCLELQLPDPPTLGGGLSLEPPSLGTLDVDADLCCKRLAFTLPLPPIPMPPLAVNGSVTAAIAAAFKLAQDFIDGQAVDCPLE